MVINVPGTNQIQTEQPNISEKYCVILIHCPTMPQKDRENSKMSSVIENILFVISISSHIGTFPFAMNSYNSEKLGIWTILGSEVFFLEISVAWQTVIFIWNIYQYHPLALYDFFALSHQWTF